VDNEYAIFCEQIRELNDEMKNMEVEMNNHKRKSEEAELRLKELKIKYDSTRSDRNLYSKQLLEANVSNPFFITALWNRADNYIFMLWFVLSSSSSFFPRLISAAADWMSAILPYMVWP